MVRAGVLTVSDKGSKGEREDRSGEAIRRMLARLEAEIVRYAIVPDEIPAIRETLRKWADQDRLDLIVTTGGTGFSPRDVTPEATAEVIERPTPGLSEAIRAEGWKKTPHAILSRGAAGIRGRTLIVNLPGSQRAVEESLEVLLPALRHGIEILRGDAGECGTPGKGEPNAR
ncbi:MAG: MogA/MoaB family molybdenum cofactor biosynthesis protein [bacterium]